MLATHHLALHEDKVGRQDLSMSSGPEGAEPGAPLDWGPGPWVWGEPWGCFHSLEFTSFCCPRCG